jgi:hypothetical protein
MLFSRTDGTWDAATVEAFHPGSSRHRVLTHGATAPKTFLLSDERWLPLTPIPPPAAASRAHQRPSRAAGTAASRAAVRLANKERPEDDDFQMDAEDNDDDDEAGSEEDEDEESEDERPPSRKRPRASSAGRATGKASKPARTSQRGRGSGVPRPPGRAPVGKVWDATNGQWVPKAASAGGGVDATPTAADASGGAVAAAGATDGGAEGGAPPRTALGAENAPAPTWEDAGPELPGWTIERRVGANGRNYTTFHGPDGFRASSRAQALKGGVRRARVAQKPVRCACPPRRFVRWPMRRAPTQDSVPPSRDASTCPPTPPRALGRWRRCPSVSSSASALKVFR